MALGFGTKIGIGVVLVGALSYLVLSDTGEGVLDTLKAISKLVISKL